MIINKIKLINYRIHKEKEIILTKGINLILGQNGSGKTSFLEAFGNALFDAGMRNNTNNYEAVKKGTDSALIEVEFTGNDGNIYTIEKKLAKTNSYTRLYLKGEKSFRLDKKDSILQKVRELSGINFNEKNIYENVITASQNKFITIFEGKDKEKEKIFNEIFNTEIYRIMYESFTKDSFDNYKKEKEIIYRDKNRLEGLIKDKKILKKQLKELNENKKINEKNFLEINKNIKILNEEKNSIIKSENEIKIINEKIKHNKKLVEEKTKNLYGGEKNLKESIDANQTLSKTKPYFDHYVKLDNDIKNLNEIIFQKEKKYKNLSLLNEEKNHIFLEIEKNKKDINNCENNRDDKEKNKKNKDVYLNQLNDEFKILNEALVDLKKEQILKINTFNSFVKEYQKNKEIDEKIKSLLNEKNILKADDSDKIEIELKKLKSEEQCIKLKLNEKEKITVNINQLNHEIKILKEAEISLKNKICPILNEQCLNINSKNNSIDYFKEKYSAIEQKLNPLIKEVNNLKNIEIEKEKINEEIIKLDQEIKTNANNKIIIDKLIAGIESLKKDKEIIVYKVKEIFLNSNLSNLIKEDMEKIKNDFTETLNELKNNISNINMQLYDKSLNIKKEQTEITETVNQIMNLGKNMEILNQKNNILKNKSEELIKKIDLIKNDITDLDNLKKESGELIIKLDSLKIHYDNYNKNLNKAGESDKFKKQIDTLKKDLNVLSIEETALTEKLNLLNKNYSVDLIDKINNQYDDLVKSKEKIETVLIEINSNIKFKQNEIDENDKNNEEFNRLKLEENKIDKKMNLTSLIRERLSVMGKLVASNLIKKIEKNATDNFRNITGRPEFIRWINDEAESYKLFLCSSDDLNSANRFDILSGGEQVAVALSVRSSMASIFTSANIAIFDEPTINLDSEKRTALAENFFKVLKNLEQAIIVTHDNNFVEMAQNVIML